MFSDLSETQIEQLMKLLATMRHSIEENPI